MATYASLVDVDDRSVQNAQELSSIWGEIRTEFEDHEAEVLDSYAILGEHDFLVLFDAADRESAFKSALTLRRHGLSAQTMEIVDTDDFANLVDEI
ncbi:GYD domain-containing protein [Haloterrigena sp. SYSU A558-1]|uniref:GYD domain-containing protein n=1 Tax=Haloterrigena gelatinilytica TaxID=2741724 RepID=A0A8J8GKJ5_9EURY|nr:GYD domain-containing protein [Haloterrigena gelatinilytica]NUB90978.1 GYD domain-containing protein [Haloterrigena gelatinilytica]NUC73204.1 GYD domain-containing protein [Haloterrigena gelatinilytica]